MTICTRPVIPNDHLQKASPSGWSFAKGWSIWVIICKRPSIRTIICKRPVDPDDHLQEAGWSGWSFGRGWPIQSIISICRYCYLLVVCCLLMLMLFACHMLLFVVWRCMLFVIVCRCLWFVVVYCLLFVIICRLPLFIACHGPSSCWPKFPVFQVPGVPSSRWPKFPVAQVHVGPKCRGPKCRGPSSQGLVHGSPQDWWVAMIPSLARRQENRHKNISVHLSLALSDTASLKKMNIFLNEYSEF